MGLRFQVTPQDVKRSKVVRPGFYLARVTAVKLEDSKDGQSKNIVIDLEGEEGDAKGVPFRYWVSEKAPGLAVPIIRAFGGKVSEEEGSDFDFEGIKGRSVRIEIITDKYQGRPQNKINDWAPSALVTGQDVQAPPMGGFGS
jgi:hypothetical protein